MQQNSKLQLEYLSVGDARQFEFYLLPKLLVDDPYFDSVDYGAKILYSKMLNRASLSAKRPDIYADEFGHVFIFYTIEEIMSTLRCSEKTACKMVKQLSDVGLIKKKRQGQGRPTIIYVMNFSSIFQNSKHYNSDDASSNINCSDMSEQHNKQFQSCIIDNSKMVNNDDQDLYFLQCSNTDLKYNDLEIKNKKEITDRSYLSFNETVKAVEDMVKYNLLKELFTASNNMPNSQGHTLADCLDVVIIVIAETLRSQQQNIIISGRPFPCTLFKNMLMKMTSEQLNEFVCSFYDNENITLIRNRKLYILTSLYNILI